MSFSSKECYKGTYFDLSSGGTKKILLSISHAFFPREIHVDFITFWKCIVFDGLYN